MYHRAFILLLMGLAGILTVALIVTADRSYAGIDGMRAVTMFAPANEQDPPRPAPAVLPGPVAQPAPSVPGVPGVPVSSTAPGTPSPSAAGSPPSATPTAPFDPGVPAASAPVSTTPSPTSSPPQGSPSPAPTPAPTGTPAPTPIPTPTPTVAISTDRGATAVVDLNDLVPGDTIVRTITVRNSGTLAFRYTVSATQAASTLLWTNTVDGLQLTVSTLGGSTRYSGALSSLGSVAGPSILAPGTTETLRYTFAFPASAGATFQGLRQDLTLVFDAVEYP